MQKVQIVMMHDAEFFTIVHDELYIFFLEPKLGIERTRQRLWIGALYFALFCNTLGSVFADPIYHIETYQRKCYRTDEKGRITHLFSLAAKVKKKTIVELATMSSFDAPLEQQLAIANSKISDQWLLGEGGGGESPLELYDKMYATLTMRLYGDFARGWTWSKNYTASAEKDSTAPAPPGGYSPSGFQFSVSPRAPLFLRPFSADSLFSGTICYPLAAGDSSSLSVLTRQPISLEHFADKGVDAALMNKLSESKHLGGAGNTNYAGIFWSFENDNHRFYCVAQTHNEALSKQAYSMIEQCEPESFECVNEYANALIAQYNAFHSDLDRRRATNNSVDLTELAATADDELAESTSTRRDSKGRSKKQLQQRAKKLGGEPSAAPYQTWESLFFTDERMREIMRLQREHRAVVVCATLNAAGVGEVRNGAGREESIQAVLEHNDTSHTTFNCVERVEFDNRESDVVYLAGLSSVWNTTAAGVVVRQSFDDGLAYVRGKASRPAYLDEVKDAATTRSPFIGLPVGTGPITLAANTVTGALMQKTTHVIWSANAAQHALLSPSNWRSRRNASWAEWERGCGINSTAVILRPARVRVSSPL